MRAFIAVEVPQEIREKAAAVSAELPEGPIAPVKPENMHITLKFLGDIDEKKTAEVVVAMEDCARTIAPFELDFFGVGAFPSLSYVRVVWLGADSEELTELADEINERFARIGFQKGEFSPHLTLARVKGRIDLVDFVQKHREDEFGGCRVEKITLFSSTLSPAGPVYEAVRTAALCGKE